MLKQEIDVKTGNENNLERATISKLELAQVPGLQNLNKKSFQIRKYHNEARKYNHS